MSLTSYRAAPPRDTPERLALDGKNRKATSRRRRSGPEMRARVRRIFREDLVREIQEGRTFPGLATTYSPTS